MQQLVTGIGTERVIVTASKTVYHKGEKYQVGDQELICLDAPIPNGYIFGRVDGNIILNTEEIVSKFGKF